MLAAHAASFPGLGQIGSGNSLLCRGFRLPGIVIHHQFESLAAPVTSVISLVSQPLYDTAASFQLGRPDDMNRPEADIFDWYLTEACVADASSLTRRPLRLGPFASEDECRAVLDNIPQVPRFRKSSFELRRMRKRRDQRLQKAYDVLLDRGVDSASLHARTMDVSRSGARLGRLVTKLNLGEIVSLHYGGQMAPFQVVWVGSGATEAQAGLECLTPEVNLWGVDWPQVDGEEALLRQIDLARHVQNRLLPHVTPALLTMDYSGSCVQAQSVGGDYYDFLDMGTGEVGFVVADVSGKGMAAALLMANLQGSLQAQFAHFQGDFPRSLASVNTHLCECTPSESYVTAFVGCYSDETRTLRYVNCGHNPPLLLRRRGAVERLPATATVLGLFSDWACTVGNTATIEPGDILSMHTDGVTEARGKGGEEFGEARLVHTLREHQELNAGELLGQVEQAVAEFQVGEQHDDATVVIARSCPLQ